MTQVQLSEKFNVTRVTIIKYLKELNIRAKDIEENDENYYKLKALIYKEVPNMDNNYIENVNKNLISNIDEIEETNVKSKNDVIGDIESQYNQNLVIIKQCTRSIECEGAYVENAIGSMVVNPALKIRKDAVTENLNIIKTVKGLGGYDFIDEDNEDEIF